MLDLQRVWLESGVFTGSPGRCSVDQALARLAEEVFFNAQRWARQLLAEISGAHFGVGQQIVGGVG